MISEQEKRERLERAHALIAITKACAKASTSDLKLLSTLLEKHGLGILLDKYYKR